MSRTYGAIETSPALCGVPGKLSRLPHATESRFIKQTWTSESRPWMTDEGRGWGPNARLRAVVRWDDECGNGQNSFSVTARVNNAKSYRDNGGIGCHHEAIADVFPELAHLVKWHLCDTRGPLHYPANAIYHAGDLDHNGLRKGELRQIKSGKTGLPAWQLVPVGADPLDSIPLHHVQKQVDAMPGDLPPVPVLEWRPWCRVGEGKARDLDAARSCAVWPEAPDSVLMLPRDELRPILDARLPALLEAMESDIRATGAIAWAVDDLLPHKSAAYLEARERLAKAEANGDSDSALDAESDMADALTDFRAPGADS